MRNSADGNNLTISEVLDSSADSDEKSLGVELTLPEDVLYDMF